jgi:hypothetical protein
MKWLMIAPAKALVILKSSNAFTPYHLTTPFAIRLARYYSRMVQKAVLLPHPYRLLNTSCGSELAAQKYHCSHLTSDSQFLRWYKSRSPRRRNRLKPSSLKQLELSRHVKLSAHSYSQRSAAKAHVGFYFQPMPCYARLLS